MKRNLRRWLPVLVSLILIGVLVAYAPWPRIFHVLADLDLSTVLILIALSLAYYLLKAFRFWYILAAMNIKQPLKPVILSYMSAQPVSLLPAGEIYRSHSLRRYTEVPVEKSIGQFTLQGWLEGSAMALLMTISAWALGTLRWAAFAVTLLTVASLILIKAGYLARTGRLLNRLPFVNFAERSIEQFNRRNRRALSRRWLPQLYGLSLLIEAVGTAIAFTSVVGLGGHLNLFQAAFFYIIPIIVGFISFLPGGIGLSEQSAIGVLLLSNVTIATAVASTLVMRVTIVGFGLIYGVVTGFVGEIYLKRTLSSQSHA